MYAVLALLLLASYATFASAGGECIRPVPRGPDTRLAEYLQTFDASDSNNVACVLGLERPWTLNRIASVHCGDCLRGEIHDAAGRELRFEWDGLPVDSPDAHCLYIGGYRDDPAATAVLPGSLEEIALITLLRLYANSTIPIPFQYQWTIVRFDCTVHPRERRESLPDLDAAQDLGLQALRLAYVLEGRWANSCAPR